jgi:hypothetical protein
MPEYPCDITPYDKEQALKRRINGEALPPIKGASEEFNAVILKASSYSSAYRFKSPEAMREALEKVRPGKFARHEYGPTYDKMPISSSHDAYGTEFKKRLTPDAKARPEPAVWTKPVSESKVVIATNSKIFVALVFLAWIGYIITMYSYMKRLPISIFFASTATIFPMINVLIPKLSMNSALSALPGILVSSLGLYEMFVYPDSVIYFLQYIFLSLILFLFCAKHRSIGVQWPIILLVLLASLWILSKVRTDSDLDADAFMPLVALAGFFIGKQERLSKRSKLCFPIGYSILILVVRAFLSLDINLHWNIFFALVPALRRSPAHGIQGWLSSLGIPPENGLLWHLGCNFGIYPGLKRR